MPRPIPLSDHEQNALGNICRTAAQRFMDHAKTFHDMIDHVPAEGDMMQIHGEGARRLMIQFETQAKEAHDLADRIANAEEMTITPYPED